MPSRIPIRFVETEEKTESAAPAAQTLSPAAPFVSTSQPPGPTPEEIGDASIYEDRTEIRRRIDRGEERDEDADRGRADDNDVAGGPDPSKLPERREDLPEREPSSASPAEFASKFDEEVIVEEPVETESPVETPIESSIGSPVESPTELALRAAHVRLERMEAELALVDGDRQNLAERLTRVSADFENYRKRSDREKSKTYQGLVGGVVQQLLPVHDNLARALEAEASVQATESEEFRHFLSGVELIYRQLDEVLKGMGLQPVETVGLPFDPHVHEAVATEQTDEFEPDTVTQELVKGYVLGDTLLRPAMVKVSTR
jgi:molecular chaperone GrpE